MKYLLLLPYTSWAFSYLLCSLLTLKKPLKHPVVSVMLLYIAVLCPACIVKIFHPTAGTLLLHCFHLLIILFIFKESTLKKLLCYILLIAVSTMIETLVVSVYLFARQFFSFGSVPITVTQLTDVSDILLISVLYTIVGIFLIRKFVHVMKVSFAYLNIRIYFQLLYPIFIPIVVQNLIIYQASEAYFPVLAVLYWLICLTSYVLFLKGSQNIRIQQEKGVLQKKRLEFVKDQLEFSKELEQECLELRKWNHDIENHLLSLSYLMDMKQYQTAQDYSQAVGQKMPDLHTNET